MGLTFVNIKFAAHNIDNHMSSALANYRHEKLEGYLIRRKGDDWQILPQVEVRKSCFMNTRLVSRVLMLD